MYIFHHLVGALVLARPLQLPPNTGRRTGTKLVRRGADVYTEGTPNSRKEMSAQ